MKKLLVVLFAAMLVLSLAAVSMAAVTVSGDFRQEFYGTSSTAASSYDSTIQNNPDFRLIFDGTTAGKTTTHMQIRAQGVVGQQKDAGSLNLGSWYCDEYWMNWATSFGNIRLGSWDYKINPQRILAKASNNNIIPRAQDQLAYDYTNPIGIYAGFVYDIQAGVDGKTLDGARDFKVGYKTAMYGIEVNMYDTMIETAGKVKQGTAVDAFYQVMPTIKLYGFSHDVSYLDKDPSGDIFVGALFTNLLGVKGAQVSLEYCPAPQDPILSGLAGKEFHPFGVQAIYPFKMGWQAEYELTNVVVGTTTENKNLLRIRVKF